MKLSRLAAIMNVLILNGHQPSETGTRSVFKPPLYSIFQITYICLIFEWSVIMVCSSILDDKLILKKHFFVYIDGSRAVVV